MTSVKLPKHYRIMYLGLLRYFQQEVENASLFFRFAAASIYSHSNHLLSLCPLHARTGKVYRSRAQKRSHRAVSRRTERTYVHAHVCVHNAHGGGRRSVFSNGVCKQVQINQVWPYFHLETIFSNMSHILKNRFRCLELVQNSCKKCSVQMKKISLQCLLLSAFLTE